MGNLRNLSGAQRGVADDETGINVASVRTAVAPHTRDYLMNKDGDPRGFWEGTTRTDITITGEVFGATGLMAAAFGTAVTIANTTEYFGNGTTGTNLLMDGEVNEEREGFKSMTINVRRDTSIVLA